jgi:two-component system, LytTR family, sensor histidine kinase AlgZ
MVEWELDPAAGNARVPPLVLQPLVENAVRHGIEPTTRGGTIRVRTQARLGQAVIRIDNTVPEMPSQPGHGMALANVRERLHLLHDVGAQFDARRDGGRYRVQIVVPL